MAVFQAAADPGAVSANTSTARKYRPELQGLRALAVALVVVYHVWLGRVSGGVDVFFVISGFLLTGQLLRAASRDRIQLRRLWGRMILRLFPAALTVLLATVAASVVLLPENRWLHTIRELIASALYLENWQLATDSVDYYAQNNTASVVQHFWSLSIQGQFYLVWPLLVALLVAVARAARQCTRVVLATTLIAIVLVSLAYSIHLTTANQPLAYFHSLTRAWEFALGGLLAFVITSVTLPSTVRIVLGWIGVVGLVSCGMVLQVGSMFPGYLALWPTMCVILVLLAGFTGSRVGADRILASRPAIYLGNLSYSLYLWHWPVLVFYLIARDRAGVGLAGGTAIIGLSLVLAALSYHLVEKPVRDSRIGTRRQWGAYGFGALAPVPILIAATIWHEVSVHKAKAYALSTNDPDHPGAIARTEGFEYWGAPNPPLIPPLVALPNEWATLGSSETCSISPYHKELNICTVAAVDPPAKRIVLVGDSHIYQYVAAVLPAAEQRNWEITLMMRGACPFSTASDSTRVTKAVSIGMPLRRKRSSTDDLTRCSPWRPATRGLG